MAVSSEGQVVVCDLGHGMECGSRCRRSGVCLPKILSVTVQTATRSYQWWRHPSRKCDDAQPQDHLGLSL